MQVFQVTELVPGPLVAQIGRIAVQWSFLELRIEQAIWQLSGLDRKAGRLLTAKENLDPRLERLKKLANQKLTGEQHQRLRAIIREVKTVGKQRHWAIHGLYGVNDKGDFHAISYRDDPKGIALKHDNDSLRAVRAAISDLRRRLETELPLQ